MKDRETPNMQQLVRISRKTANGKLAGEKSLRTFLDSFLLNLLGFPVNKDRKGFTSSPCPQSLLCFQNGGRAEKPLDKAAKIIQEE